MNEKRIKFVEDTLDFLDGDTPSNEEVAEVFLEFAKILESQEESLNKKIQELEDNVSASREEDSKTTKETTKSIQNQIAELRKVHENNINKISLNFQEKIISLADSIPEQQENFDKEAFRSSLLEEVSRICKEIAPVAVEAKELSADDIINKINESKLPIDPKKIPSLADIERMAKANAVPAVPVTTSVFFNNGTQVGRAKNINIVGNPDVVIQGDTATIYNVTTGPIAPSNPVLYQLWYDTT
jgi:hypothetical protein